MSFEPIINPELPYVGEIEGGLVPGKMVKVQGSVPPNSTRFAINYQLGPNLNPRDDIALHVSPCFPEGIIRRNSIISMSWGPEESHGPLPIQPGTSFEIIILCEYKCFKIAVNGRHFTEFSHRLPFSRITHLVIDGEVQISSIFYEVIPIGPPPSAPDVPHVDVGPPAPGGLYPTLNPQGKYGPPPSSDGYNNPPGSYVHHPEKTEEDTFGGLDKVGLAVGGLMAAGGVAAAMHAYNKNKQKYAEEGEHKKSEASENESGFGGLGALGAALASSLASNAFDKNSHAQQGYPPLDLGSILGALGGGGGGGGHGNYQQPPASDPLSGILGGSGLGSILGGVLGGGGGGGTHQPQYQPSGGYGNYPQQNQGGGGGSDLLGGLLSSALDGLSKHSQKSHHNDPDNSSHYSAPPPNYGPPQGGSARPPSPPPPGGGKLSAKEISRGLGLGDDDD